jgi:TonB family protein
MEKQVFGQVKTGQNTEARLSALEFAAHTRAVAHGPHKNLDYKTKLFRKFQHNWTPYEDGTDRFAPVVVLAYISPFGALMSCKVEQSSGNKVKDENAKHAVIASAPFDPPPHVRKQDGCEVIRVEFNIMKTGTIIVTEYP